LKVREAIGGGRERNEQSKWPAGSRSETFALNQR